MVRRQPCDKIILDVAFQTYKNSVHDERLLLKTKVNNLTFVYNQNLTNLIDKCNSNIETAWKKYQQTKEKVKKK